MTFTHPAARGAKLWTARMKSGERKNLLVVMTNAELNQNKKRYNGVVLERLVATLQEYIELDAEIDGYILANCLRDWENSRD